MNLFTTIRFVQWFFVFLTVAQFRIAKTSIYHQISETNNSNVSSTICTLNSADYLSCRGNVDDDSAFETIVSSFFNSNIRNVLISNVNLGNFNLSIFDDISDNLKTFAVSKCSFTSVSLAIGKTWPSLVKFEFTGNDVSFIETETTNLLPFWSPLSRNKAPNLYTLNLTGNNFGRFVHAVESSWLDFSEFKLLRNLDLSNNALQSCPQLPFSLSWLNLRRNLIREVTVGTFSNVTELEEIDFSNNMLQKIVADDFDESSTTKLRRLNLSSNLLTTIEESFSNLTRLETLDLSGNRIKILQSASISFLTSLRTLLLTDNPLIDVQPLPYLLNLESLDLSRTDVEVINLKIFYKLQHLKSLTMQDSKLLRSIVGKISENLPSLEKFNVKNCSITFMPFDFFQNTTSLRFVDASNNPWPCNCRLSWLTNNFPTSVKFINYEKTYCLQNGTDKKILFADLTTVNITANGTCSLGATVINGTIFRAKYGETVLLDCGVYGEPQPAVTWRRIDVDPPVQITNNVSSDEQTYVLYDDGTLRLTNVYPNDRGIYECFISNGYGNFTTYVRLRLSYAEDWWFVKVASVFCGILTALGFFALNMIYGAIRRLIIWRLNAMEQNSRIRSLLESLEKYRQRQMEYLHEIYSSNMNQVRDNYHQQVEQLRKSYSAQAERFRGYRTAQMESVVQHIDNVRDNYANQMNRMRDYGSRQMERLWESYQSRVNRLRDFSFQQRLRVMRQYKIKQRYLNKLLETLNVESCRRRPNSTVMRPELIELPRIMPEDDYPSFDDNDRMLSRVQSSYLDPLCQQPSASSRSIYVTGDERDDFDDDASSYHSFPEEMFFISDPNDVVEEEAAQRSPTTEPDERASFYVGNAAHAETNV